MRLGELVDGELHGTERRIVERHLDFCGDCRQEAVQLRTLGERIGSFSSVAAPGGLWAAIEKRLDRQNGQNGRRDETGDGDASVHSRRPQPARRSRFLRLAARPLAAAAAVLLVVGLGWMAINATPQAMAAEIDFRPLLEQANGDVAAGIQALMGAYGGHAISASQAAERMTVRIAAPAELPGGLRLEGRYLLHMGRSHTSLAFHYTGPGGKHLLLMQCPPMIERNYGGRECMACSAGNHQGHGVQVGKLHLMHMGSDNVCICIVSTLKKPALDAAMHAVKITF